MTSDCINREQLLRVGAADLSATDRDALELHLAECLHCRRQLAAGYRAREESTELLSAPGSLRARAKGLGTQPARTDTVVALPRRPGARRLYPQMALAAVVLIGLGLAGYYALRFRPAPGPGPGPDTLRQGSPGNGSVLLVSPAAGADLAGGNIQFRWSGPPAAKSYTLTVLDQNGDIVAQPQTAENSLTLTTEALGPVKGRRYFWYVTARLADGTTQDSLTAEFVLVE